MPFASATPMRSPVYEPGPIETASAVRSAGVRLALRQQCAHGGRKLDGVVVLGKPRLFGEHLLPIVQREADKLRGGIQCE